MSYHDNLISSSSSCSGVADPVDSSLDNQLGQCSIEMPWFRTCSKSFCQKKIIVQYSNVTKSTVVYIVFNNALI